MVFGSIFGTLASLVLITETAKITRDTITKTAGEARKPQRLGPPQPSLIQRNTTNPININIRAKPLDLGLKPTNFNTKPVRLDAQGILKDFKQKRGLAF
jgi:hypothetical protein